MKTIIDYAELVKENHALNKTIASVETDETDASKAYQVGEQLIFNGTLYDVIAPISQHDVITTTGSGANIAPAGSISAKIQALTNNVKARAELSAYNLLNIFNSEINTTGTYTEVINNDGTVTIGGTPTSACTIPYRATTKYNGNVYNLKPSTDYVLDSGLSAISPLNLQVFVKENSSSSWAKIAESTVNTKLAFTTPASFYDLWVRILVPANAVVPADIIVKPMIVLASDITIGFVPYAKTNRELTNELADEVSYDAETGVKNLYNYSLVSGTESQGITYTINADKSILAKGTASVASATFGLGKVSLKAGTYKFSCVAPSSVRARVLDENASPVTVLGTDEGSGVEFTLASDNDNISVQLIFNQSFGEYNAVIKPMITKANIPNSDYAHYVPYAMTNRELTEKINEEFLQNTASISAQINYKDVYLFTTNGGSSSGSAQYSSAYLVFGQATTQITYFALKEGTEITPSVDGTTFTLTASTSITMAYRKL